MNKNVVRRILNLGVVISLALSTVVPVLATNVDTINNSTSPIPTTGAAAKDTLEADISESISTEFEPKQTEMTENTESISTEQSEFETISQSEELQTSESVDSSSISEESTTEDETFVAPIITEDNQHVLGNTMKNQRANLARLNWDSSKLPRTDFIDISSHQGTMTVADFKNLRKYGITGVIVKLTEATSYRNPFAAEQIKNAKSAGMKVSVYHYSWFSSKKTAEAEADYFIKFAKELGLNSSTVMINDIEQFDIKGKGATANSVYFANCLTDTKATKTVLHYSSLSWFTDGTLNEKKLGGPGSVWMAQYPYTPSNKNLLHTDKSAWQWASDVKFPGDSRQFDVNIDYKGVLSKMGKPQVDGEGPYINNNKYVKITKTGYNLFSNFKFKVKSQTKDHLNKIYLAKGKYNHSNGSTYYSLYDSNGVWQGYLNADVTIVAKDQGPWLKHSQIVSIKGKQDSTTNFKSSVKKTNAQLYKKTYQVIGKYQHVNGKTYYSLYDSKENWMGYIEKAATEDSTVIGKALKTKFYVTITKDNYDIWKNFNWVRKAGSASVLNETFIVKNQYTNFNGRVYYSLYDLKGNWYGYINKNGSKKLGNQGPFIPLNKNVTIKKNGYNTWSNFNKKLRYNPSKVYKKKFIAKGQYKHVNGKTVYYSIYDSKGKWFGYINKDATVK